MVAAPRLACCSATSPRSRTPLSAGPLDAPRPHGRRRRHPRRPRRRPGRPHREMAQRARIDADRAGPVRSRPPSTGSASCSTGPCAACSTGRPPCSLDRAGPGVVLDLSAVHHDPDALTLVMVAATAWLQAVLARPDGPPRLQVLDEAWASSPPNAPPATSRPAGSSAGPTASPTSPSSTASPTCGPKPTTAPPPPRSRWASSPTPRPGSCSASRPTRSPTPPTLLGLTATEAALLPRLGQGPSAVEGRRPHRGGRARHRRTANVAVRHRRPDGGADEAGPPNCRRPALRGAAAAARQRPRYRSGRAGPRRSSAAPAIVVPSAGALARRGSSADGQPFTADAGRHRRGRAGRSEARRATRRAAWPAPSGAAIPGPVAYWAARCRRGRRPPWASRSVSGG